MNKIKRKEIANKLEHLLKRENKKPVLPEKTSVVPGLRKQLFNTRAQAIKSSRLQEISVKQLSPSEFQPRKAFDEAGLAELAEAIRRQGVLQPLIVQRHGIDQYRIIAGERRWRAAKLADLKTVPVIIKEISRASALEISLIENIQRENLSPIEEAEALLRLQNEFNLSHEEIGKRIGKARTTVTNMLRLLNLEENTKQQLREGKIDAGHAKALLHLDKKEQKVMADMVVEQKLSVRDMEKAIKSRAQSARPIQPTAPTPTQKFSDNLVLWEKKLKEMNILVKLKLANDRHILANFETIEAFERLCNRCVMTDEVEK